MAACVGVDLRHPLALAIRQVFGDKFVSPPRYALLHLLSFWTLCGLLAFEGYWRLRDYVPEGTWSWSAWAYGLGLCLLAVSTLGRD
jgi:hypothetical protein